jgi:hypothetical protein
VIHPMLAGNADNLAHLAYFDTEHQLSFVVNAETYPIVQICPGGYGEPPTATFICPVPLETLSLAAFEDACQQWMKGLIPTATTAWWVLVEREHTSLAVGPYITEEEATRAMEDALLIEGLVQEDCTDCFITRTPEVGEDGWVLIDRADPDHMG